MGWQLWLLFMHWTHLGWAGEALYLVHSFTGGVQPCKFQRHYCEHSRTTTKIWAGGKGVVILFNTKTAELKGNWLELTRSLANHSDWLFRSGVMCTCDCEVLTRYQSDLYRSSVWCLLSHLRRVPVKGLTNHLWINMECALLSYIWLFLQKLF